MSVSGAPSSNVADLAAAKAFLKPMPTQRPAEPASGGPVPAEARGADETSTCTRLFPLCDPVEGESGSAADVAGLKLGHFVIEERIGRGGMGAVFRAIDQQLDRVVALKVLAPEHSRDASAVQRFHNEARAAARLDHENIARAYFFGEDQGLQFIAFEFVRGTNIRDFILQKGMLTPPQAVNYALQIAQALRHTHAAGVVHRDIKPSNIIITPSGRAKLVDLGLARQENGTPASQELTVAGTTLGTFDYIAPEQARDPRNVDVRADIYSLGCTLYHMLTGEPPFPTGSMIQKVVDHHRGAAPDPAALNPAVPEQLSRIVRKMMASNPDERYASPDHLVNELVLVAHALGLRPEHPDGLVWATPLFSRPSMIWLFWQQNRAWLLTIAALLVIVVGINRIPWQLLAASDEANGGQTPQPFVPPPPGAAVETLVRTAKPGVPAVTAPQVNSAATVEEGTSRSHLNHDVTSAQETTPALPASGEEAGPAMASGQGTVVPPAGSGGESDAIARDDEGPSAGTTTAATPGEFVVLEGTTERHFSSLEAACLQAGKEARIELRFDGPREIRDGPIVIDGKHIVISAPPGSRPELVFTAPLEVGLSAPTQMIRVVRDGSLQLNDVDIVMQVEQIPADDDWALIVLDRADGIEMRGVSIRVINPDLEPASVIELVESADAGLERMNLAMEMRHVIGIELEDCLVTGRCDLLKQSTVDPATVSLRNVATALRGTLMRILGDLEHTPNNDQKLTIQLRNVSAILNDGLLRVDTEVAGELLPMNIACEASLLLVNPNEPLIEMLGHQSADYLKDRLEFDNTGSYFDMRDPAWVIWADEGRFQQDRFYRQFGSAGTSDLVSDQFARSINWDQDEFNDFGPEDFTLRAGSIVERSAAGVWTSGETQHNLWARWSVSGD